MPHDSHSRTRSVPVLTGLTILSWLAFCSAEDPTPKESSVFYPTELIERAKVNAEKYPWAAEMREEIVEAAQPWLKFSDDGLWALMFGNTIRRSWMVWSDGHCPSCKKGVPMYNWEVRAVVRPWKMRCPHCQELFPKNDFHKFYVSGLNEHGIFVAKGADRSLLFNAEHPDPEDPLHKFGVDDGEGYVEGRKRWRFIGTYLIYGQWKQAVLGGIKALSAAYVVTGDTAYARKAGILLDRVADLYPTFDFKREGVLYEGRGSAGYISTWHDACEETRQIVLAYDQVRGALKEDEELARFLSRKVQQFKLDGPKNSPEDVLHNIEDRILNDALRNSHKIHSNYPRREIALAIIKTGLGWPENRKEVMSMIDGMTRRVTAVDGMTGEKGLANYSAFVIQSFARFLAQYDRTDPDFLPDLLKRHPRLHQTYRFHLDTWCLHKYYPLSGDCGWFAKSFDRYQGVVLNKKSGLTPSMFTFLCRLYELTGDAGFVQALYLANDKSLDGLPYDLFVEDAAQMQQKVREVIEREGPLPRLGSVNKQQWHLAILRSGEGENARALWLDYDSGGGHGHADGLNLGLFAKGLDLMPDFGYPPVNYGGWGAPRARWYKITASHNTVVVDGRGQASGAGRTTLWADGEAFRAMCASAPNLIGGKRYERAAVLVDISDDDFYVIDLFRVVGGTDHAKFMHSHFGQVTTKGLTLKPGSNYGHGVQMRGFRTDPSPQPGWSADWDIEDRYELLPSGSDIHLRYTDLTHDAQASTCEAWVSTGGYSSNEEAWIPRLMIRRRTKEPPLASTFVATIGAYEGEPGIAAVRRLKLVRPNGEASRDSDVAVETQLADGRHDLFVCIDSAKPVIKAPAVSGTQDPIGLDDAEEKEDGELAVGSAIKEEGSILLKEWNLRLDGEICFIRRSKDGAIELIATCRTRSVQVGDLSVRFTKPTEFTELTIEDGRASVVSGNPAGVELAPNKGK